jgi:hypothetical protein
MPRIYDAPTVHTSQLPYTVPRSLKLLLANVVNLHLRLDQVLYSRNGTSSHSTTRTREPIADVPTSLGVQGGLKERISGECRGIEDREGY